MATECHNIASRMILKVVSEGSYSCPHSLILEAAKLAPIYKKDPVTHPSNYRMLAASNTLYRLFTNVLRSMATYLTATFYLEAPAACDSDT
eukprot:1145616-Pelagomonas_calceolata.AAC.2